MNNSLESLFTRANKSALSDVLNTPPRVVNDIVPPPPEAPEPQFDPNTGSNTAQNRYDEDDEYEDGENRRLEPEELVAMAEAKSMKFGVFIELGVNLINAFAILSPDDWKVYKDHQLRLRDSVPVYAPQHPINKVLQKVERFEKAKANSAITPEQRKTLQKSILVELKIKNKHNRVKPYGMWGAISDIVLAKTGDAASDLGLRLLDMALERFNNHQ